MLVCVKRHPAYALVVVLALSFAGCRQADGALPPATGTVPNELGDISRDLQNLASGDPGGPKDLGDDLSHYAEGTNGGPSAAAELSRRLGQALTGKTFKLADVMPLAHTSWVAVAGRQLSEKPMLGVNEQQAQEVAAQVGVVQQAVTARHRRWYELL